MIPYSWVSFNFVDRLSCMHENIQRFYYTSRKKWTRVEGHGSSQVVTSHKSRVTPIYLQKTEKPPSKNSKDTKKKARCIFVPFPWFISSQNRIIFHQPHDFPEKIQKEFPSKNSLPFGGRGPVIKPFLPKNHGVQWKLWDASNSSYLSNIAIFHLHDYGRKSNLSFLLDVFLGSAPMIMGSIFLAFRDHFPLTSMIFSGERG